MTDHDHFAGTIGGARVVMRSHRYLVRQPLPPTGAELQLLDSYIAGPLLRLRAISAPRGTTFFMTQFAYLRRGDPRDTVRITTPISRGEYERLRHQAVAEVRHTRTYIDDGCHWHVDTYSDGPARLTIASAEITISTPPPGRRWWAAADVSSDARYTGFALATQRDFVEVVDDGAGSSA